MGVHGAFSVSLAIGSLDNSLEVIHLRAVAEGGGHEESNLVTGCARCHKRHDRKSQSR